MSSTYGNKPSSISDPSQWHEISFQISIDRPVDWDEVDMRKWAHVVARYTALTMARSLESDDEKEDDDEEEIIKTLLLGLRVDRINLVTDDALHGIIDEFEE